MKNHDEVTRNAVAYYDSISVKPYVHPFLKPGETERGLPEIESILSLNRDMDPYVRKACCGRTKLLNRDEFVPLSFLHFSDVHGVLDLWNRITEFLNHYDDCLSFALHTGDYCGDSQDQFVDFYAEGIPAKLPVLNCVGNHDTVAGPNWEKQSKRSTWEKLFCHTGNWDATFLDCDWSMTYYRDFPASNVRLIVLDLYYDLEKQVTWLEQVLEEARAKGLHVITAMHQPSGPIVRKVDTTFQTLTAFQEGEEVPFDAVIGRFIQSGGHYICNLAGHYHSDWFGYTANGVLNIAVECATDWSGWCEGCRTRGTRCYDCFNVVAVDTDLGLLKLVRIGDNADHYLRTKRVLCYDYQNRTVVYNG